MGRFFLFLFLIILFFGLITAIENPAAKNCIEKGYKYQIKKDIQGNEFGECIIKGKEINEWEVYNRVAQNFESLPNISKQKNNDKSFSLLMKTIDLKEEQSNNLKLQSSVEIFDWRNNSGNWLTPIKSQGACGSCWAFSTIGVIESRVNIDLNLPDYDLDLSEQDLVSCSGAGNCSGGLEQPAFEYIKNNGIVKEEGFPYLASDLSCERNVLEGLVKIINYTKINNDFDSIKYAITNYGPITAYLIACNDFVAYESGIYTSNWNQDCLANFSKKGHSIAIVGYNDDEQYWIGKNSWGVRWGEEGYFKINYSESVYNYDEWSKNASDLRMFFLDKSYAAIQTDIIKEIIITEIMKNPSSVSDSNGEYFELYNVENFSVNINGWEIKDSESNSHVIENNGNLTIPSNNYLVLCREGDISINGGINCDYDYSEFVLGNDEDEIILINNYNIEVDRVEYNKNDFPNTPGVSMELINFSLDNNISSNWQNALLVFGDGDYGTPGKSNSDCIPNWVQVISPICQEGDYQIIWFNDSNSCFSKTGLALDNIPLENSTENFSCDYNNDSFIGNISNINTTIENLSLIKKNNKIYFEKENQTLIEFNFSSSEINLADIFIEQQEQDNFSYLLIRGLNLVNQTKTIYFDRVLNGTGICIKDEEIFSVNEISSGCDGENEFWLSCPGTNSQYSCELNNSRYKISGLNHSGIKEQESYCGDGSCNGAEVCDVCVGDCGACSSPVTVNVGGGGGGSSSSPRQITSKVVNQVEDAIDLINKTEDLEDLDIVETKEINVFTITGAAIISAFKNNQTFSIVFILGIVGVFVVLGLLRMRKKSVLPKSKKSKGF